MKTWRHLLAGTILALAGAAAGQVQQSQFGRALDASSLMGSGGVNSIRSANRAVDSNLYVTGQVTGGFQFRGISLTSSNAALLQSGVIDPRQFVTGVPDFLRGSAGVGYAAANQLRTNVPSAALDDFVRGTAGLERLGTGNVYGANPYFSRERTVVGSGGIAAGQNVPGTSIPRATYVPPRAAQRLYDSAVAAYKPIVAELGEKLLINALVQPLAPASATLPTATELLSELSVVRPTASVLFGVVGQAEQERLVAELGEQQAARWQKPVEPVDMMVKPALPEPTEPEAEPPEGVQVPVPSEQMPQPGQDVFLDVLMEMERMAQEAADRRRAGEEPGAKTPLTLPETEAEVPEDPRARERHAQQQAKQSVERVRDQLILHKLAGKSRDLYNLRMTMAEKALSQGKFYEAAAHYEIAVALNRGNPLAHLGRAMALLGANEPLSAAVHLRGAMKRFPPLMATGVDVNGLLGKRVVDVQIADLEKRLGGKPEAALIYLAAFVRASRGETQKASAHAKRLQALSSDEVYRAYAEFLLTGSAGRKQATTRKAP